jgi:signal transduction histidine kinase
MLLTGYADLESVIDAINRSNIFRYVKKPWVDADIISAVEEGHRYYVANSMISLKNSELQRAYDELDKFAYSVTHDIRGPLLSVLGAIDIAQYINDMSEMRDMLNLMENSVRNLDKYIQNMHDYYNLKRGELQIEEINFKEIVTELEETYRFTAKLSQVHFNIKILQQEPFRCDKMSIKIILNNLLSNAFKYQKKDIENKMVELDIKVATGTATIYVRDNGIGIPEKYAEKIFTMFFRATTEEVGSGFGLYNVKDALLKLNGKIKVDSGIDKGSVFTVTIPNK